MNTIQRYVSIWAIYAKTSLQAQLASKISTFLFVSAKLVRFVLFFILIQEITSRTTLLAGYTHTEIVVFYLTFTLIDLYTQLIYRGVYTFAGKVRSGEFDFVLLKPVNSLFSSLIGSPDINDIIVAFPVTFFALHYIFSLTTVAPTQFAVFFFLLICGFFISTAFHIFILCFGILTSEVDNAIWVFRSISQFGRMPVEVYREPIRWFITFVVPISLMMNAPVYALLEKPHFLVTISPIVTTAFLVTSVLTWNRVIRRYVGAGK
ncbi:MAG: hypothetical protein UX04_C0002G0147 [Microgenomates group bacterium GW2011_GWF2_45_18]|nr:MAG: hypothetical protein UW18_C0005G0026 [Microgenomates group bacterium GW2011_GWF1_44_10]KKU02004.1 MAG: hypothetical protein UX04_C0002G0147 [Microgenomates group bacterium GW2011_GWF2_45_18]OGJ41190.1 MAG: hypothetical protein A2378_00905 [Candidatus Pacebacteria bacterium RIFOXYB1_FULL_44_10]HAU99010.1 hypothetical protein [Candidatus Paceibacterota bacterium]HAX01276.1 hypothetical protein [Candidatus Paceibacterota bacterium]